MIRAAIFDMDGLLIDSEPLWMQAELETFSALGVPISAERCAETRGFRLSEVVSHWHRRHPWTGDGPEAVAERLLGRVAALIRQKAQPLPGALDAIRFARRRCEAVGLASSSPLPLIEAALARFDARSMFDAVHSAEQETHGKPHPAIYLTAASRLGIPPVECVALEDSINGVISAKAARMTCIAVPEAGARQDPRFAIADARLGSLSELDDALWRRLGGNL
jgi:mannitol-1-/sugar-/sorbitol-6-/2-deoxyglucose-6-phosphatase